MTLQEELDAVALFIEWQQETAAAGVAPTLERYEDHLRYSRSSGLLMAVREVAWDSSATASERVDKIATLLREIDV